MGIISLVQTLMASHLGWRWMTHVEWFERIRLFALMEDVCDVKASSW